MSTLLNWHAIRAIYRFEMARTFRTLTQSLISPVLSTSLYFIVFGTAIGSGASAAHLRSVALGSTTATTAPDQVMAGPRDIEISDATRGVILRSPNGTRYRVGVTNAGTLTVTAV